MSEKTTNIPCPGCGWPMKEGESVVLNLGPGPVMLHATCVEAREYTADDVSHCTKCGKPFTDGKYGAAWPDGRGLYQHTECPPPEQTFQG